MRRSVLALAVLSAGCTTGSGSDPATGLGPACGKGDKRWVGQYTMQGVPEVGSQLRINADGSFDFYLAYGANDQVGRGCWTQNERLIALIPAGKSTVAPDHTPDTRGFTGIILYKRGGDLVWEIAGSHAKGRYVK